MMNKKQVFEHYSAILDDLLDNSLWFDTYFQQPYMLDEDIVGAHWNRLDSDFALRCGATRGCLIDESYDYVVKFDIEEDEFGSACDREEQIYLRAREEHLDQYFAEVEYIGTYEHTINFYDLYKIEQAITWYGYGEEEFDKIFAEGEDEMGDIHPITISIPLYGYRRAEYYSLSQNTPATLSKEMEADVKRCASPLRSRQIAVAVAFLVEYGMDEYRRFSAFGMKHDINDLHFNNIGCIDGHFVLIDYSGYHNADSCWEEDEDNEWKTGTDEEE